MGRQKKRGGTSQVPPQMNTSEQTWVDNTQCLNSDQQHNLFELKGGCNE